MEIESSGVFGPHVTGEQLDRLRDGTLPPAVVAAVGRHASACEACGSAVGEVLSLDRRTRDLRMQFEAGDETGHLSDDALMAIADGASGDDTHLQECEICRAELDALLAFKSTMQPRVHRRWLPYAVAASIAAIALAIPLLHRTPRTPPAPPPASTSSVLASPEPPPVAVAAAYDRPEWVALVGGVKARRALPMPAVIAELRPQKTGLRGPAEEDDLRLSPDHAVIAGARPRFRWIERPGASYRVIVRNGDEVVESDALPDAHWTPPHDLQRGREYQWQVEVTAGAERSIYPRAPDPPARFRVLGQSAVEEISEVRKRYPGDALVQAVILARHGLRDETLAALDRLERSDAKLANDLRRSLRSWPP